MNHWSIKKIICYLTYKLIAKHLPGPGEFLMLGKMCHRFRSKISKPLFRDAAEKIGVGKNADFDNGSNIIMRDHANIGPEALISGKLGTVTIGKHVMMGSKCIIITQNHNYLEKGYEGFIGKDVLIDDYAWIGHRVTILPGVKIGKHAIVGAGAVVTKDVPDCGIAVGNPAVIKKIRKRQPA